MVKNLQIQTQSVKTKPENSCQTSINRFFLSGRTADRRFSSLPAEYREKILPEEKRPPLAARRAAALRLGGFRLGGFRLGGFRLSILESGVYTPASFQGERQISPSPFESRDDPKGRKGPWAVF